MTRNLTRTIAASVVIALSFACSQSVVVHSPGEQGERLRQDKPAEARAFAASKREGASPEKYRLAREAVERMPRYSTARPDVVAGGRIQSDAALATWQSLGPGNIGGRTRAVAFDPIDPNIMYAAGVSGGIWKTTDAGGHWRPLDDQMANIAVNSLVIDPKDRNVLYAGTGEGYFREEVRGTGLPLRGAGIFVSQDAGETWTRLPSTDDEDFHWVNDLVISRHESRRIYAATRTGVWRSDDSGGSWNRVLATTVRGGCLDLEPREDSAQDYLFASCGTFERATVYRNRDAASSNDWESVLSEPSMGRTSLSVAPSRPSTIYALSASNGGTGVPQQGLHAVFRSDADGDAGSWTATVRDTTSDQLARVLLTNPIAALSPVCDPQSGSALVQMGWYVNVIAVDPLDPERVWAAGVDLFRSDDGGRTWGPASYWWAEEDEPSFAHADHHSIYFHPAYDGSSNQTMFSATDGGVYRTDNARAEVAKGTTAVCEPSSSHVSFRSLNRNYGVTQFYQGSVFPDGRSYLGGTQDNGTLRGRDEAGADAWVRVWGGDGGYSAIDPDDPRTFYASSQVGHFVKTTNGGETFQPATNGLQNEGGFLFIAPLTMDPSDSRRLWTGGSRLWRTTNGASSWLAASAPVQGRVSAIAIAPGQAARVLAGTNSGWIYRSAGALQSTSTTVWSGVQPRQGFVSSLAVHPSFPDIVYATYAGFGGAHVWKSSDAGATWSSIDGNLPDMPVHSLVVDAGRDRLYLGTDLGVMVSLDDGASWNVENTGFANAVTEWITLGPGPDGLSLYAFTHGRGLWRVKVENETPRRRPARR